MSAGFTPIMEKYETVSLGDALKVASVRDALQEMREMMKKYTFLSTQEVAQLLQGRNSDDLHILSWILPDKDKRCVIRSISFSFFRSVDGSNPRFLISVLPGTGCTAISETVSRKENITQKEQRQFSRAIKEGLGLAEMAKDLQKE